MKFFDSTIQDFLRQQREIDAILNPSRNLLKSFGLHRQLADEIELRQVGLDNLTFRKLAGEAEKSLAATASAALGEQINSLRPNNALTGKTLEDLDRFSTFAERIAKDELDLVAAIRGQSLTLDTQARWLAEMQPWTALDILGLGARQHGFDDTASEMPVSAHTAGEKIDLRPISGIDESTLQTPCSEHQETEPFAQPSLSLVSNPAAAKQRNDDDPHSAGFVRNVPFIYEYCWNTFLLLRADIDRGMRNSYGTLWFDDHACVPEATRTRWASSARTDGFTPTNGAEWLIYADDPALIELIATQWDRLYEYRILDREEFLSAVGQLCVVRRLTARMPQSMTAFDVKFLALAVSEIEKVFSLRRVRQ